MGPLSCLHPEAAVGAADDPEISSVPEPETNRGYGAGVKACTRSEASFSAACSVLLSTLAFPKDALANPPYFLLINQIAVLNRLK